jgi:DNA end-binding protein Ku
MRSIWKGSISFGLVNIPVRLYSASKERELKFVLLHKKDHSQIRYARICKTEDKEIPWSEIEKGFEYKDGQYVVLSQEDFNKADPEKTKSIEIVNFVDESEVDTIYFAKPYYLEPEKNAGSAYSLLRESLKKAKKVGIAKYVFHNHEHIGVIKPYGDLLLLMQLRYDEEIVVPEELKTGKTTKATSKEIQMALKLIEQLTEPFNPQEFKDTYTEEIKEIIAKKAKGKKIQPKGGGEVKPTKVHDIMSLLKASLEEDKKPKKKKKNKIA